MAQSSTDPAAGEGNETAITVISLNARDGTRITLAYRARLAIPCSSQPAVASILRPCRRSLTLPLTQIMPLSLAPSNLCRRPVARRPARS